MTDINNLEKAQKCKNLITLSKLLLDNARVLCEKFEMQKYVFSEIEDDCNNIIDIISNWDSNGDIQIEKMKIKDTTLKGMTKSRLARQGIKNIGDLLATEEYMLLMRGITLKQLEEIKKYLAGKGLQLKENPESIVDKPLSAAPLSERTKNGVRNLSPKIHLVKDLENLTYEDLCRCRNMGKKSIEELLSFMSENNIYLKERK